MLWIAKYRSCFFIVCLVVCSLNIHAQKYGLSAEAGYHFGIQTKNNNDAPFPSTLSYSLGSGVSRQLMFHVFPDSSNWYFSTGFFHIGGTGVIVAKQRSINGEETYNAQELSLNSLRWVNKLTYSFHLRNFELKLSAGFVIPIINSMQEETYLNDSNGRSKTTASIKNYTSLGFTGGLGLTMPLTKKIKVFCNTDIFILNSKVKSRKVHSYSDEMGRNFEDIFPTIGSREFLYRRDVSEIRNNADVLRTSYNSALPTDKLSYTRSYSSVGIQVGFMFLF